MGGVGGKANDNDPMLLGKVAELICAVGIMSVQDKKTVAVACVPFRRCWFKVPFEPLAPKLLIGPSFGGMRDAGALLDVQVREYVAVGHYKVHTSHCTG